MKIHVVDGTYELFRAFYGAPSRVTHDDREVGAVVALMRSLHALLKHDDVTHVACAFDHTIESFRNELFEGYKTADGVDPSLLSQFPLAEQGARAIGIVVWPMTEFEADDALASAAHKYQADPAVDQVVICSPDKDLMQCVAGRRVVTWDRLRQRVYDEGGVMEKFGVPPALIPDYLALVGDAADGIPGVARWGAKSAATLLARYPGLERIPRSERSWDIKVRSAPALAASLRACHQDALLYRELATLRTDVPLAQSAEDLRWRSFDPAAMHELSLTLEAPRLVEELRGASSRFDEA